MLYNMTAPTFFLQIQRKFGITILLDLSSIIEASNIWSGPDEETNNCIKLRYNADSKEYTNSIVVQR